MIELVGFSGYARSGKDTAARVLEGYQRVAFADTMREFLYRLNPVVGEDSRKASYVRVSDVIDSVGWNGYKESYWGGEIRKLMQRLGTECGRQLMGEDVWVNAALDNLSPGKYTVTDVRFVNEADAIKARGGKLIRIERPGIGPVNDHISETGLDDYPNFDAVIINDGSVSDLRRKLYDVL